MCKGERTHASTYNSQHFYTWMWKWSTQNRVYPIPIMTIATLQKVVHATFLWHSISIFFFLNWSVQIWKSIIYNCRDQDKHSRWWKKFEQIIILKNASYIIVGLTVWIVHFLNVKDITLIGDVTLKEGT